MTCKFDFRQHAEIGAAAYANVEYQAAPANLRARDFIGKQLAPSRKPPMLGFDLGLNIVYLFFQVASCHLPTLHNFDQLTRLPPVEILGPPLERMMVTIFELFGIPSVRCRWIFGIAGLRTASLG